jgi:TM2 domain-containing membrane protein YozV
MYYLRQQTRVSGPFSVEQVRTLLRKGRVARSDKISEDRTTWRPIGDCPEIIEHPAAAAPAAAVVAEPQAVAAVEDGHEWFYAMGGVQQPTAIGTAALRDLLSSGSVGPTDLVWRTGFADWQPVSGVPELVDAVPASRGCPAFSLPDPAPEPGLPPVAAGGRGRTTGAAVGRTDYESFVAKKLPAGVVALLMGPLGIHKFMLGLTTAGIVTLVLCVLLVPIPVLSLIALVEGITYLTKSDAQFYEDYAVRKKQWF